ncbi:hypothetical protein SUGI_0270510 [Cryptomeria japonica]|nr:hypothetical protein SUGI_0270510 [Cryptomeria japonica]
MLFLSALKKCLTKDNTFTCAKKESFSKLAELSSPSEASNITDHVSTKVKVIVTEEISGTVPLGCKVRLHLELQV